MSLSEHPEIASVLDELPFWSAPFGMDLLERIHLAPNMNVLDIGCGTGFPLTELAMRLGSTCQVYGIDPWEGVLERARLKIKVYGLENVTLATGTAENMPFTSGFFHRIVSNNGLNNVQNLTQALKECYRVAAPGCQMVFTMNTHRTMEEFYTLFAEALMEEDLPECIEQMNRHIDRKRPPVASVLKLLRKCGFRLIRKHRNRFYYRFTDGTAMLNHGFIRLAFRQPWEELIPPEKRHQVFHLVEQKMNEQARKDGHFVLTVPFVTIEATKPRR